jgi:type I restriction enzyme S subunit
MMPVYDLEEISEFVLDGTHGSPERTEVGVPVLSAQNVINGSLSYETDRYTSQTEFALFSKRVSLKRNDVLLTIVGTIGRVAVVNEERPAVFQRSVAIIRPKKEAVCSRFLCRAMQSDLFRSQLDRATNKSAQAGVYLGKLKKTKIPLPPLPEQRRIAAILDQADALRAKRREALAKLDEMAQAIFVEMFGDPQINERKWQTVPCSELCQRINVGVVIKPASYYCETGVPALRGTNIKPYGIDLTDLVYFSKRDSDGPLSKSRLRAGDLVIVRTGQPGLAAVVPPDLDNANAIDVIIVTPIQECMNSVFMRELLNSKGGRQMVMQQSRGQIQQHFNVGSLSAAELIVPPIKLQNEFAGRVEAVSGLRSLALRSLEEVNFLFASLQHRAFSGEL